MRVKASLPFTLYYSRRSRSNHTFSPNWEKRERSQVTSNNISSITGNTGFYSFTRTWCPNGLSTPSPMARHDLHRNGRLHRGSKNMLPYSQFRLECPKTGLVCTAKLKKLTLHRREWQTSECQTQVESLLREATLPLRWGNKWGIQ